MIRRVALAVAAVPGLLLLWNTWTLAPGSRLAPLWVLMPTLVLAGALAVRRTGTEVGSPEVGVPAPVPVGPPPPLGPGDRARELRLLGWLLALGVLVLLLGFSLAVPAFLAPYLRVEAGLSRKRALFAAGTFTALFLLFSATMLQGSLPRGLLGF